MHAFDYVAIIYLHLGKKDEEESLYFLAFTIVSYLLCVNLIEGKGKKYRERENIFRQKKKKLIRLVIIVYERLDTVSLKFELSRKFWLENWRVQVFAKMKLNFI